SSERSVSGENSGGGTVTRKSAPGPRLAVKEGEGPSGGRGGPGIALWRPVGPRTLSRHTPRIGGLMAGKRLAILTLAVLAGCGGDRGAQMAADSLSRDLQRLPVDSSATLNDQAGATPVPEAVAAKPAAKPAA